MGGEAEFPGWKRGSLDHPSPVTLAPVNFQKHIEMNIFRLENPEFPKENLISYSKQGMLVI